MAMVKMVVQHEGHAAGSKDFDNQWRALYAHYVWLHEGEEIYRLLRMRSLSTFVKVSRVHSAHFGKAEIGLPQHECA